MIRITSRDVHAIEKLDETSFERERLPKHFLRDLISRNAQAFLSEIGEPNLLLLRPERFALAGARERIDLLGVDTDGTVVVIELKRSKDKGQMLQALSYAAMISKKEPAWFESELLPEQLSELRSNADLKINRQQRIVLVAEEFTRNVVIACQWMAQFRVNVRCVDFRIAKSSAGELCLGFSNVYPPLYGDLTPQVPLPAELESLAGEIASYVRSRAQDTSNRTGEGPQKSGPLAAEDAKTWDEFVASIKGQELAQFLKRWEENGERILPESSHRLVYPSNPERWRIEARPTKNQA